MMMVYYDDAPGHSASQLGINFFFFFFLFEQTNERFRNSWDLPNFLTVIKKKGESQKNSV